MRPLGLMLPWCLSLVGLVCVVFFCCSMMMHSVVCILSDHSHHSTTLICLSHHSATHTTTIPLHNFTTWTGICCVQNLFSLLPLHFVCELTIVDHFFQVSSLITTTDNSSAKLIKTHKITVSFLFSS